MRSTNTRRGFLLRWLAAACLALGWQTANTSPGENPAIGEFLLRSGIEKQLSSISTLAVEEADQRRNVLSETQFKELANTIAGVFDAKGLRQRVVMILTANYDQEKFGSWLTQLKTPLTKRMHELTESAENTDMRTLIEFRQTLERNPPSPQRQELIRRLDLSTHATQIAVDTQLAVNYLVLRTVNPMLPRDTQLTQDEINRLTSQTRFQFESDLQEVARVTYLYVYRDVSDSDLAEHVRIQESPLGRWISDLTEKAIREALEAALGAGSPV